MNSLLFKSPILRQSGVSTLTRSLINRQQFRAISDLNEEYKSDDVYDLSNNVVEPNLPELSEAGQQTQRKEIISAAPIELTTSRVVRIFKEAKSATQSGNFNGKFWKLDWDVLGKANRWENDLMGYQSTADTQQCTNLKFETKDSAVRFAEQHGWDYYVQEPKERRFRKKEYAVNFVHTPGPLKHIRTK